MNQKAKDLVNKAQFKQQRFFCMIISELGIKEIIKKYQNGETLSKSDCNALLKSKIKQLNFFHMRADSKSMKKDLWLSLT